MDGLWYRRGKSMGSITASADSSVSAVEIEPGTKEKLLNAAREILLEKGHQYATVKEISRVAGVNHGLVHHYFKSKEQLFVELLNREESYVLSDLANQPGNDEEMIQYLMKNLFSHTRLHVEFHSLANEMPVVKEVLKKFIRNYHAVIQDIFRKQDELTAMLVVATVGGLVLHYNVDSTLPLKELLQRLHQIALK